MIHKTIIFGFLTLLSVFFMHLVNSMIQRPIVETKYGSVRGIYMHSRSNRTFTAFLNIPYALPPVSELRFQPPQPPQAWEGVRDAGNEGPPCPQTNFFFLDIQEKYVGDEDCLTLNVYTPDISNTDLPVMFYVFGGGFLFGSGSIRLHGPEYFMDKDVVLVTINYRVGLFGFLSTEDTTVPGNMGLKDQVMALKWVNENIALFGGNPNLVTLFGNSAGASSVHLHMQSPLSKGLYLRGISQSGTALSAFAIIGPGSSSKITLSFADKVNCSKESMKDIIECLRTVPKKTLLMAQDDILNSRFDNNVLYRPVVEPPGTENPFLTLSPFTATTTSDWMTGVNNDEGAYKYALISLQGSDRLDYINKNFDEFGPQSLIIDDTTSDAVTVTKKVRQFYFGDSSISKATIPQLINMYTDGWIASSSLKAARQHNGTLYFYLFNHLGKYTFPQYFGLTGNYGVSHCDELIYLFTIKNIFKGELNEKDTKLSKLMIDLWTNFATFGTPTPEPISNNPLNPQGPHTFTWEKMTPNVNTKYCNIQSNHLEMEENLFAERNTFWNSIKLYDKLNN